MASFEFLAIVVSILGLAASIVYYANILNNANKTQKQQLETRQAQLFMQIYNHLREEKFQNYLLEIRQWEIKDFDTAVAIYGNNPDAIAKINYVNSFFEGVGVLVADGFLDRALVGKLMATFLFNHWKIFRGVNEEFRIRSNRPELWKHTEFLYQELMKQYISEYGHEYNPTLELQMPHTFKEAN